MTLDKNYSATAVEPQHYAAWEQAGLFACQTHSPQKPFCIMMPPPNVTGNLHMGHALTFTLQDILVRFQRMQGADALWQPGTDHAGIATQMVVERQLAAQKTDRRTLGREKFLEKVWAWKAESGGNITRQLRRLGASPDWSRERFTMDAGLSAAVTKIFVQLYREKLLYRDKRLVNWDPTLLTAVSDLEVESRDVNGFMWHIKYPVVKDPTQFLCIATTRPETMLGDGAVAVNPNDERYKHLIGEYVTLPIANRKIPVIADEAADPEMGSGAVKITAAHDFNDFAVWQRHRDKPYFAQQQNGGLINLFDEHACLNDNVPPDYRGLDRFVARKKIVAELEAQGLVDKIVPLRHAVPHGDRSGVVLEPRLSDQWYVDAAALAAPAIRAVEEGRTQFVPATWTNTYYSWLKNIQPWCVSRQLWWGHQIPAWYGPDGQVFVAESEAEAMAEAEKIYGKNPTLTRDADVLDTWFSSALWPFSTLGWPDTTAHLARYYPTDVLVTGFDIIFFWVARMMMMGLHVMGDVPFRTVYIHGLIRDADGQKMSKTKGNVIDPLSVIDQYGCDALRLTLAQLCAPGRDIRLAEKRIEGNRNFVTKLWNAARFCQMNDCVWQENFDHRTVGLAINQWIVGEISQCANNVAEQLKNYRFDLAAQAAYAFVWDQFCDWYVEFAKPVFAGADEVAKAETRATAAWTMEQILRMLQPFMPFVTAELFKDFGAQKFGTLMTCAWPDIQAPQGGQDVGLIIKLISAIRTVRSELNVPGSASIVLLVKDATPHQQKALHDYASFIQRLARVASIEFVAASVGQSAQDVGDGMTLMLPLADVIDLAAERTRLKKEEEKCKAEIDKINVKLSNSDFVAKAPPEVIDDHRDRLQENQERLAKLSAAQQLLSA